MKKYIDPLLRWWWLIFLCTALAAGSSYLAIERMPPIYEARSTLVVGRTYNNPNPTSGDLYLEQQLASVYANVGNQGQLNAPTMEALGLSSLPIYYIRPIPNTPLIQILVSDSDPMRVAAVTNELANQFVKSSPSSNNPTTEQRQEFINSQLEKLQLEILDTEEKITQANQQLAEANSARQIADIQTLLGALSQKRISLQGNYAALLQNTSEGASNNIRVLQYATQPRYPVGPNKLLYLGLATTLGFFLAVAVAYMIEIVDNRIKTSDEIAEILGSTIIGHIPFIPVENRGFYTDNNPRSPITDSFRTLRTNIEFMGVSHPTKVILVTGTEPSIGKSVVAANLAFVFAQANKRIILIDADLRQPMIHHILGLENLLGVTDACLARHSLDEILVSWERKNDLDDSIVDEIWKKSSNCIKILPSGLLPPNPAELIASSRFSDLLDELSSFSDMVIIDSPPISIPDTSILLSKVDGVVMVFQAKRTWRKPIQMAKEQIDRSLARVIGVVINQSSVRSSYYPYRYGNQHKKKNGRWKLSLPRIRPEEKVLK